MDLVAREPDQDPQVVASALERAGLASPERPDDAVSVPHTPVAEPPHGAAAGVRSLIRRLVRRAAAPVSARLVPRLADRLVVPVTARLQPEVAGLDARIGSVEAQLQVMAGASRIVARVAELGSLLDGERDLAERLDGLSVNFELLKDEIRSVELVLDDLSFAVAPGAGRVGVSERFAELRARVEAIDRRLRLLADRPDGTETSSTRSSDGLEDEGGAAPFDYTGFELRFRGDPDDVLATTLARYPDLLRVPGAVLDVGCGTGSLVEALVSGGVAATGIDLDPASVAQAQARGLPVLHRDALEHLRSIEPSSLSAITAIQVVEHLHLDQLMELLELARTRLRPGGFLIAETPNPTSLIVLSNNYILDPTHVWPLHPSLLTFLCERAGFEHVRLQFEAPAEAYHLARLDLAPDAPEWARSIDASFERLNQVLFGPQDYAVIARVGND